MSQIKSNLDVGDYLADFKWDGTNALSSLDKLYGFAYQEGKRAEAWYWRKTNEKKRWAMWLRVIAILSVTAAGIIPILSPILMVPGGTTPLINPIWSSVAIAFGTAALGLDKFFGFSSGWIRYVTSALNVKAWLIEFKYDWDLNMAIMDASNHENTERENEAKLQEMITKCSAFALKISTAVQEETKQWAQEFQSSLSSLDQTLKQQAASNQPSGLVINLEDGDGFKSGWEIEVNGRKAGKHYGKTGVLTNLYPGLYQIVISASAGENLLHAEAAVKVTAGEIVICNLKLA